MHFQRSRQKKNNSTISFETFSSSKCTNKKLMLMQPKATEKSVCHSQRMNHICVEYFSTFFHVVSVVFTLWIRFLLHPEWLSTFATRKISFISHSMSISNLFVLFLLLQLHRVLSQSFTHVRFGIGIWVRWQTLKMQLHCRVQNDEMIAIRNILLNVKQTLFQSMQPETSHFWPQANQASGKFSNERRMFYFNRVKMSFWASNWFLSFKSSLKIDEKANFLC